MIDISGMIISLLNNLLEGGLYIWKLNISVGFLIGSVGIVGILFAIRKWWEKWKEGRCNQREIKQEQLNLPSWAISPDVERAEWINRILRRMWPTVTHNANTFMKEVIEPYVCSSQKARYIRFSFRRMSLDDKPLRIEGVKVYENNVPLSQITMDVDIAYDGVCDVSCTLLGMAGGMKNFQIRGTMRFVLKPFLTSVPFIGALQMCFVKNPTFDFKCYGLAAGFGVLRPVRNKIHNLIMQQIAGLMVLPNKWTYRISDEVPETLFRMPEPKGVLFIHVVEAKQLMCRKKINSCVVITAGNSEFCSLTDKNKVNPKWDFWCESIVHELQGLELVLRVYRVTTCLRRRVFLGRATVDVSHAVKNGLVDLWMTLEGVKKGMVHLQMFWLTLSSSFGNLDEAIAETRRLLHPNCSTGLLMVFVDSAKNLPNNRRSEKPNPLAKLSLGNKHYVTRVQLNTRDPVWEENCTFLVKNLQTDTLCVKVIDRRSRRKICYPAYGVRSLVTQQDLQVDDQPCILTNSGQDSQIYLSLKLRILKYEGPREEENEEGRSEGELQDQSPLVREDSSISTAPSESSTPVRISTQESRDLLQSGPSSSFQQPDEDLITLPEAPGVVDTLPPSGSLRRSRRCRRAP